MGAMKRNKPKPEKGGARFQNAPRSLDAKGLKASVGLLRELLAEADAISARMEEMGIGSLIVPTGYGSAAYERTKASMKAWVRGLREALHERIENPDTPVDGDDA